MTLKELLKRGKEKPIVLLIDGDIMTYQAVFENQVETYNEATDEYQWTLPRKKARDDIAGKIDELIDITHAAGVHVCFTARNNWRKREYAEYKANRSMQKPLGYEALRQWVIDELQNVVAGLEVDGKNHPWRTSALIDELEADDLLGMVATGPDTLAKHTPVIVSTDKDMRSIPCILMQIDDAGVWTWEEIDRKTADRNHLLQTLTGDTTDNYPGCPGIGPVKAERVIGNLVGKKAWAAVVHAFEAAGQTEEFALQMARCARILRHGEYDWNKMEVKLWTP